jgi:hypothetical protein
VLHRVVTSALVRRSKRHWGRSKGRNWEILWVPYSWHPHLAKHLHGNCACTNTKARLCMRNTRSPLRSSNAQAGSLVCHLPALTADIFPVPHGPAVELGTEVASITAFEERGRRQQRRLRGRTPMQSRTTQGAVCDTHLGSLRLFWLPPRRLAD